jgi:hypothetical protein
MRATLFRKQTTWIRPAPRSSGLRQKWQCGVPSSYEERQKNKKWERRPTSGRLCAAPPFYCKGKMGESLSAQRLWFLYLGPTTYQQTGLGSCVLGLHNMSSGVVTLGWSRSFIIDERLPQSGRRLATLADL